MFKRKVLSVQEVVAKALREQGLETPLLQKRVIDLWPEVAGAVVARYTTGLSFSNQTLYVRIQNPALRQDLSMMRSQLAQRLNEAAGAFVVADIRIN